MDFRSPANCVNVQTPPSTEVTAKPERGVYFAKSYRGKTVCIDSGIMHATRHLMYELADDITLIAAKTSINNFLGLYDEVWFDNGRELLRLDRLEPYYSQEKHPTDPRPGRTVTVIRYTPYARVPNLSIMEFYAGAHTQGG